VVQVQRRTDDFEADLVSRDRRGRSGSRADFREVTASQHLVDVPAGAVYPLTEVALSGRRVARVVDTAPDSYVLSRARECCDGCEYL